jgi:hypothetical protein
MPFVVPAPHQCLHGFRCNGLQRMMQQTFAGNGAGMVSPVLSGSA